MKFDDFTHNGAKLRFFRAVNDIRVVFAFVEKRYVGRIFMGVVGELVPFRIFIGFGD